jgi:hypothetical protein
LVAINNVSPIAYKLLTSALYADKDENGAEVAAKRGVELAPNSAELAMSLMDIQTARGKPLDALSTARAFAVANPGSLGDSIVADALLRLKRTSEAEIVLEKSLLAKPDSRVASSLSKLAFLWALEQRAWRCREVGVKIPAISKCARNMVRQSRPASRQTRRVTRPC